MDINFQLIDTFFGSVHLFEGVVRKDSRGQFQRLFCTKEFNEFFGQNVSQVNHSRSALAGTVRGMHYQKAPYQEKKIIRCIAGEVWDVFVDVRPESQTFLEYDAVKLTAANNLFLLIPEGFAHGFQALTDNTDLIYFHSCPYQASAEAGLNAIDPKLNIKWPLEVKALSERDQRHSFL